MSKSNLFVSGTRLAWIDGLVTRSVLGVEPTSIPSGFSGLQPGRIWLAQDHRDEYLWYSDSGSTTRFVVGVYRGEFTETPAGRVFINTGSCTTGQDLWWFTPSASVRLGFSARAEGAGDSQNIHMQVSVFGGAGSAKAVMYPLFGVPRQNITVDGLWFQYFDSTKAGCTSTCTGCTPDSQSVSLTWPAGYTGVAVSQSLSSYTANTLSYRWDSSSMEINNTSSIYGFDSAICVDVDNTWATLVPLGCTTAATNTNLKCGVACQNSIPDCQGTDGCTQCSTVSSTCVGPNGPGDGGDPDGIGCGQLCVPIDNQCGVECPVCEGTDEFSGTCRSFGPGGGNPT